MESSSCSNFPNYQKYDLTKPQIKQKGTGINHESVRLLSPIKLPVDIGRNKSEIDALEKRMPVRWRDKSHAASACIPHRNNFASKTSR